MLHRAARGLYETSIYLFMIRNEDKRKIYYKKVEVTYV